MKNDPKTEPARRWHPRSAEEYTGLRQEITAWYQRMSGVYAFSVAALAVLLKVQLDSYYGPTPERARYPGMATFVGISILTYASMALVGRTYSLATRQASYIQVFFEEGDANPGWVTHSRAAWSKYMDRAPRGVTWTERFSEQKIFCLLVVAAQLSSAWFLYRACSPEVDHALPLAGLVGAGAIFLFEASRLRRRAQPQWWRVPILEMLAAFVYFVKLATVDSVAVSVVGMAVFTLSLRIFAVATRDTAADWVKFWRLVKDEEARTSGGSEAPIPCTTQAATGPLPGTGT